jgi:hypothetical protein
MYLQDFCTIEYRNRPWDYNRGPKNWGLQNLDTYFQLNPMMEIEAIKYDTLHLNGEAHEWWYHGIVTLGHVGITSYLDFT